MIVKPPFKQEFLFCTLIETTISGKETFGTGFFYCNNDSVYLITNLHIIRQFVIEDDEYTDEIILDKWAYPKEINYKFRYDEKNLLKTKWNSLDLFSEDNAPLFIIDEDGADLVAIPFNENFDNSPHECLSKERFLDEDKLITAGDKVTVLGYPLKLYDPNTCFPVMREGIISTPFYWKYRGEECFLIDARSHDGMSGSPVFSLPSAVFRSTDNTTILAEHPATFFLGVFSEEVPSPMRLEKGSMEEAAELDDDEKSLDLNKVWRSGLIEKMLS